MSRDDREIWLRAHALEQRCAALEAERDFANRQLSDQCSREAKAAEEFTARIEALEAALERVIYWIPPERYLELTAFERGTIVSEARALLKGEGR